VTGLRFRPAIMLNQLLRRARALLPGGWAGRRMTPVG
jgi:hypothetical protein